jgi:hypothetical protein
MNLRGAFRRCGSAAPPRSFCRCCGAVISLRFEAACDPERSSPVQRSIRYLWIKAVRYSQVSSAITSETATRSWFWDAQQDYCEVKQDSRGWRLRRSPPKGYGEYHRNIQSQTRDSLAEVLNEQALTAIHRFYQEVRVSVDDLFGRPTNFERRFKIAVSNDLIEF